MCGFVVHHDVPAVLNLSIKETPERAGSRWVWPAEAHIIWNERDAA